MGAKVLLVSPKYPHNVGQAFRACALFGADELTYSGFRVPPVDEWPEGSRLPREERLKLYQHVGLRHTDSLDYTIDQYAKHGITPVAVEKRDRAESLAAFQHPRDALYVFGPEDASLGQSVLGRCHRFLRLPTVDEMRNVPYGLAGAVYVTLAHRCMLKVDELARQADEAQRAFDEGMEELDWINANPRAAQRKYGAGRYRRRNT